MPDDERRLNGALDRRSLMRACSRTPCQVVQSRIFSGKLSGLGVDTPHHNSAPKASPAEPHIALVLDDEIAVDSVPIVLSLGRPNDKTLVNPLVIGAVRVECFVGGQPNGGIILAKGRNRVV